MGAGSTSDRATLLMVSHCVPVQAGQRRRSRAWQLLACAATRHRVELIAQVDAPVHMDDWRTLTQLAAGVTLISGWPGTQLARVHAAAAEALHKGRFDTVLCTAAALWCEPIRRAQAYRVVDLDVPQSQELCGRADTADPMTRWRLNRRALRAHAQETLAAEQCDALLLSRRENLAGFGQFAQRTHIAPRQDDDKLIELLTAPPAPLGSPHPIPAFVTAPLRRAA